MNLVLRTVSVSEDVAQCDRSNHRKIAQTNLLLTRAGTHSGIYFASRFKNKAPSQFNWRKNNSLITFDAVERPVMNEKEL